MSHDLPVARDALRAVVAEGGRMPHDWDLLREATR